MRAFKTALIALVVGAAGGVGAYFALGGTLEGARLALVQPGKPASADTPKDGTRDTPADATRNRPKPGNRDPRPDTASREETEPEAQPRERRSDRRGRRGGRTVSVTTASVQLRPLGNRVAAVGTGRAFRSLTLLADVSGVVEAVKFTPGQSVAEGHELVVLDSEAQRIAVKLARVKVDDAQAKLDRYQALAKREAVAGVQLEEARTALATAKAELEAKQYDLKRRIITAPFAGVMGLTKLGPGDYLREGTEIATIDDTSKLIVEFVVAERYAPAIKLGMPVRALTPAILGVVFRGAVSAKDSRIGTASRTLRVEATLPNEDRRLIPGLTFSVSIRIEGPKLPMVPGLAVSWDREGAHVWVVREGNKVERVGVRIRRRTNRSAWLEGKLKEGEKVVVEGVQGLRPGAEVRVVEGD